MPFDLIVRQAQLVTPQGLQRADFAVQGEQIAQIAPSIAEDALQEIDAADAYLFPGFIDAHVHFNEPGRADWEGLSSGSAALAAGGGTCFFDMPLNSEPPVLDAEQLRIKRALAEEKSCVDFALWGGLTPLNLDRLGGLRDAGAIGLKAFMSASGIDSFPRADAKTLREGMKRAAKLGLLVAVHAEDEALAAQHTAAQKAAGRTDAAAWLASRPIEVELAAIRQAIEFAGETGCALHIVHVTSPEGIELVSEARENRVDVTAETCPHYLLLNDRDVARIGAAAKCAPPIRSEANRRGLWEKVLAREIHTIGSDHSPAPEEMKTSPNFFEIWGGIGGVQHGFPLLLSERRKTLAQDWPILAAALASQVARRFAIDERKGELREGLDADFTLVAPASAHEIAADELWTRHAISPYIGRKLHVAVTHTFVRGQAVYFDRRFTNVTRRARFIRRG
jgi:allantoinase